MYTLKVYKNCVRILLRCAAWRVCGILPGSKKKLDNAEGNKFDHVSCWARCKSKTRSRQKASVIGCATRPVLIVVTGLGFATRRRFFYKRICILICIYIYGLFDYLIRIRLHNEFEPKVNPSHIRHAYCHSICQVNLNRDSL